jgi:hypothetical protein
MATRPRRGSSCAAGMGMTTRVTHSQRLDHAKGNVMKVVSKLVPLVLLIPCVVAAQAPPPGGGGPPPGGPPTAESILARLDKDKDGFVSKAEVEGSRLANRFDETDKNKDGKLSLDELKAMPMRAPGGAPPPAQ